MPTPWRRGVVDTVKYVVVERDGVQEERQLDGIEDSAPTKTLLQPTRRSNTRRQAPSPTDDNDESDDDDDDRPLIPLSTPLYMTTTSPSAALTSGPSTFLYKMAPVSYSSSTVDALADSDPTATIIVTISPTKQPHHDRDGRISQTTEHLLIAAGSIGATIIIVMVILAMYTMRKRGLTLKDVFQNGMNQVRRGPPAPPSKNDMEDNKQQQFQDDYRRTKSVYPPPLARTNTRSDSFSTQTPLRNLARSDSFGERGLEGNSSQSKSFYDDSESRSNVHRRNESATPSSPVLPLQGQRQSASTRNTRSLVGDEEPLRYSDTPADRALPPAPPTFRQFLSNRPTISQRSGFGGGIASRFSWTNSNAPQTPRDPTRDTVNQPMARDSFVTTRSSVPRFRTVDSWVNQQSNRVEAQRLKQQFRMTQSSTSSDDIDQVPEMPELPSSLQRRPSGLAGKNIKHQRHDTSTSVNTAPIFRAHPGTEVRFSMRSPVPSEVLDMGRKNAAL